MSGFTSVRVRPPTATAMVASGLFALTMLASILHTVLTWQLSGDQRRVREAADPVAASRTMPDRPISPDDVLVVLALLMLASAVAFLIWLGQARRVAETVNPGAGHRLGQAWLIGGWFTPVLQLWYPLHTVTDVQRASDPARPDSGKEVRLLWWVSWSGYWVAFWSFFVFWLLTGSDLMRPMSTGDPEADLENIVEHSAKIYLLLDLGVTTLSVLLTASAVLGSTLILRITGRQAELIDQASPVGPRVGG